MSKKKLKRKRRRPLVRLLLVIIAIFVLGLIALLGIRFGFLEDLFSNKQPVEFTLQGECYLVLDRLFYSVDDSDDCKKECDNDCWVRGMELYSSEYLEAPESCNYCECACI